MAGDSRRGSGPAESGNVAGGRWSPLPKRIHQDHGLRGGTLNQLSEPIYEFEKRRYHLNWHASGRRLRPKATRLPASRQSHAIGHTWSGATEPERRSRLTDSLIDNFLIDNDRGSTLL